MTAEYTNILVAVDGSDEARIGLDKAIKIAKKDGAKLHIMHVIDTRTFAAVEHYDRMIFSEAEKYAEELLEKYKEIATEAGIENIALIIDYGSPKIKIAKDAVKKYGIDLIIVGATGLNAVERFLIGSVSEYITRQARCDVLIVRNN